MALLHMISFQEKEFGAKNNFKTTELDDLLQDPSCPGASDSLTLVIQKQMSSELDKGSASSSALSLLRYSLSDCLSV
jgi:hypothetical protein